MKTEQLKQRKMELSLEVNKIDRELAKAFKAEHFPKMSKEYSDTYWQCTNSYGNGQKWSVYVHAKKVVELWDTGGNGPNCRVAVDSFEMTRDNILQIHLDSEMYYFNLKRKITKRQFKAAVSKILAKAIDAANV